MSNTDTETEIRSSLKAKKFTKKKGVLMIKYLFKSLIFAVR
jgi:hypothetical protein